ncbi:Trm112 family protein [Dongshaea marina]|uniref:Trm112 family protein n=1 Tax=Dongshaea marina TaxID=2047966 RepID=UPI0019010715|nr:Trm112 family protein [Dongshaea marina]
MALDHRLFEIIACPVCKGKLHYDKAKEELICRGDRLAYPIEDNIPVLLESRARELTLEEISS